MDFYHPAIGTSVVAAALVAYTYLGYPALIAVCAAFRPRKMVHSPMSVLAGIDATPMVSVLLPAFNAATVLPNKVRSLFEQSYPAERLEILVYCDGCTDDTELVARALAAQPQASGRMRVFADSLRRGKPTALNFLAAQAKGQLLLLNDARQALSPNAIEVLAKELLDPIVGCVTGRLVLAGKAGSGVYWRYEDWIRSQESRFRGVVGMTGALAMMRQSDFIALPPDTVLDDVWIPMQIVLKGKRVVSVRDAEAFDTAFTDDKEFYRKARTLAGNYQFFARLPALLSPFHNPIWFETMSHKALRLLAPWLLLLLLLSSIALAASGEWILLASQLAFYGMAALGPRAGRVAVLARTFVVLNAAAVVGLWRYLAGGQRVTW